MTSEYCSCERPLVLNGCIRCEICNKPNYESIHAADRYRCSKCGEIMAYNQTEHDLRRHRFG